MNKKLFITDFIGNDNAAKSLILDFKNNNKLFLKGSTGIGGTTTMLGCIDQTILVISPLVGMVIGKELNRQPHQLFIYKKSKDRWSDVSEKFNTNQNFVLNTTPEQILELKKTNTSLFNKIIQQKLFIDESHIAGEASYRHSLAEFFHIVYTQWQNKFTLSTATPTIDNLDIPSNILSSMAVYHICRKDEQTKPIDILPYKTYQQWVLNEIAIGRRVVLFTNNEKVIKHLSQFTHFITQILAGDILKVKVKAIKQHTDEDVYKMDAGEINDKADLLILSTKYLTGFDVPFDASVAILANYNPVLKVENKTINDIVQAYGRIRTTVHTAAIFYENKLYNDTTSITAYKQQLNEELFSTNQIGANHLSVCQKYIPQIELSRTYTDKQDFANNLTRFGFDAKIIEESTTTFIPSGSTYSDSIRYITNLDHEIIKKDNDIVHTNIKGDNEDYNGYSSPMVGLLSCCYIAKLVEDEWLSATILNSDRLEDLTNCVKTYLDANTDDSSHFYNGSTPKYHQPQREVKSALNNGVANSKKRLEIFRKNNPTFSKCEYIINTLYTIDKVKNETIVTEEDRQNIELMSTLSTYLTNKTHTIAANNNGVTVSKIIENIDNDKIRIVEIKTIELQHTERDVLKLLSFTPTTTQLEYLVKKAREYKKILTQKNIITLDNQNIQTIKQRLSNINYSKKQQKKQHKVYLLGLLSKNISGHYFGFKTTKKDGREYNFITKCPKYLRKYTPIEMIEVDIIAANAQIVDKIIDTNIAEEVYSNLQTTENITRNEAKVLYNSTLNNYKLPKAKAIEIYLKAGYSNDKAIELANLSCGKKIFYLMAEKEEQIINMYTQTNQLQNSVRCHDGIFVIKNTYHSNLPITNMGTNFKINEI